MFAEKCNFVPKKEMHFSKTSIKAVADCLRLLRWNYQSYNMALEDDDFRVLHSSPRFHPHPLVFFQASALFLFSPAFFLAMSISFSNLPLPAKHLRNSTENGR